MAGILDRSTYPGAQDASPSDLMSGDEETMCHAVERMFQVARSARMPMVRNWRRCYSVLRNQGPRRTVVPQWYPDTRVPEVFPICAMRVGWKTDQRIDISISPQSPFGSDFTGFMAERCSDLEAVLDANWYVTGGEIQLTRGLWDQEWIGTQIFKTTWDETLAGGLGDASVRRIHPFNFYPDPTACDTHDGNFYIEVRRMSLQEVEERWPGSGRKLASHLGSYDSADNPPSQLDSQLSSRPRINPAAVSPATSPRWGTPGSARLNMLEAQEVLILECWWRNVDSDNEPGTREAAPWHVTVTAPQAHVVLMDEPATELWRHGKHPYDRAVPNDMGEFWGISMVDLLAPTQEGINRLVSAIQHNIELTGNPILLEDRGGGTARNRIAGNQPGTRISKRQGTETKWMEPPALHGQTPELLRYFLNRMETVSGLSAISKGGQPAGRPSSQVIDIMTEAANVRIRVEQRVLEDCLHGAFLKASDLIGENYTGPRVVSITGPDGEPTAKMLGARHFCYPTPGGPPLEYSIRVEAGSGRHTSRKVREDLAIQLRSMNALSVEGLLEAVRWPNVKKEVRRLGIESESWVGQESLPGKRERARA